MGDIVYELNRSYLGALKSGGSRSAGGYGSGGSILPADVNNAVARSLRAARSQYKSGDGPNVADWVRLRLRRNGVAEDQVEDATKSYMNKYFWGIGPKSAAVAKAKAGSDRVGRVGQGGPVGRGRGNIITKPDRRAQRRAELQFQMDQEAAKRQPMFVFTGKDVADGLKEGAVSVGEEAARTLTLNMWRPNWGGNEVSRGFVRYGTLPLQIMAGGSAAASLGSKVAALPVVGKYVGTLLNAGKAIDEGIAARPVATRILGKAVVGGAKGIASGIAANAPGAIIHDEPVFDKRSMVIDGLIGAITHTIPGKSTARSGNSKAAVGETASGALLDDAVARTGYIPGKGVKVSAEPLSPFKGKTWRWAEPGELPRNIAGTTDKYGNVIINPSLSGKQLAETLRHEGVHSYLTPTEGTFLSSTRAKIQTNARKKLQFVRYLEEALAEGVAKRNVAAGANYPFKHPEIYQLDRGIVAKQGAAYLGGTAAGMYLGNRFMRQQLAKRSLEEDD